MWMIPLAGRHPSRRRGWSQEGYRSLCCEVPSPQRKAGIERRTFTADASRPCTDESRAIRTGCCRGATGPVIAEANQYTQKASNDHHRTKGKGRGFRKDLGSHASLCHATKLRTRLLRPYTNIGKGNTEVATANKREVDSQEICIHSYQYSSSDFSASSPICSASFARSMAKSREK